MECKVSYVLSCAESNAAVKMINNYIRDVIMTSFIMVNGWLIGTYSWNSSEKRHNFLLFP